MSSSDTSVSNSGKTGGDAGAMGMAMSGATGGVGLGAGVGTGAGVGLLGAVILILYGIVPTYQPSHFGRVYAAYGGWFIILSILWGWLVDHVEPDRFDIIGAMVCLVGVTVIMYWPR